MSPKVPAKPEGKKKLPITIEVKREVTEKYECGALITDIAC